MYFLIRLGFNEPISTTTMTLLPQRCRQHTTTKQCHLSMNYEMQQHYLQENHTLDNHQCGSHKSHRTCSFYKKQMKSYLIICLYHVINSAYMLITLCSTVKNPQCYITFIYTEIVTI